ncbi:unnamed protein product [Gulo gulo]|uniref:Olfactory receptor n=1 Tax=Gulo gulo TaxID=48420 RepID=A0A9X9LM23_GULGU|nr:unnamed protein product [Gulo gulo]
MILPNITQFSPMFYLTGFPGLEAIEHWIFIPFFLMYLVAISGNCFILIIIKTNPRLHTPMYYLLSFLALTDLGLSVSTLPTTVGIFWFKSHGIYLAACQIQMFCIHSFSFMESSVLLIMSFDRCLAICHPLRYSVIITSQRVIRTGLAIIFRGPVALIPLVVLLKTFPYCGPRVLSHAYCLHQDMIRLACSDTRFNRLYGLCIIMLAMGSDVLFILISYSVILRAMLAIASVGERLKALNTCVSHILAVLCFYVPVLGLSIVHRFGHHTSPLVHILMGTISVLFPPLMNPIIYSIKTQQIRRAILKVVSLGKIQ